MLSSIVLLEVASNLHLYHLLSTWTGLSLSILRCGFCFALESEKIGADADGKLHSSALGV